MKLAFRKKFFFVFTLMLLGTGFIVSSLNAQYFGRNKVQYDKFDFKILKTEHFDVYFYPEEEEAAKIGARMAERWYSRLSRMFNHELKGRQPLIFYSSSPHFQQTMAIPGVIGEGTGGVTESFKRRVILPFGASLDESDHVIGHELVHAFQYSITSQGHPGYSGASPGMMRIPLWFIEGLAEYLSTGPVDPLTSMWMRDATRLKKMPTVQKMENPYEYFPYRYGQALWAYITGRWGDQTVARIMKGVSRTGDFQSVMRKVLGVDMKTLSEDWHASLENIYNPLAQKTNIKESSSRLLFKGTEENPLNISPSLSPDGDEVIFLSSRDLFSIDMYQADAETGKIKRKLVKTATNPHFESLQFIKSAGSWGMGGKSFILAGIRKGQPILSVINPETGKREREISFPEMGEILNPTWSPDGRYVAFSALIGGFSDIFIYDLEKQILRRMTDDPYADLYPAWAPDGHSIAFTTDRFSTDLSILSVGTYEMALMDPETGDIKKLPGFDRGKHINPQWAHDSKSLYFLSDHNGISNVYRIDLSTQKISQVTNLYTGANGITSLSPALSVAQETGRIAYCVYEEKNYSIYSIDSPEGLKGKEEIAEFEIDPSILPPREKSEGALLGLLKNPLFGLPRETEYEVADYSPKLGLDYITPPTMAIGVDRYGSYGGGGIAMFFSDMLGYHSLSSMLIVSTRLKDSAAAVGYQNSRSRLNWGAVIQRIPYVSVGYSPTVPGVVNGEAAWIQQEIIFRQSNHQVAGFASYPFSQVQRVEFYGGYQFIDFDYELRTRAFSAFDNRKILDEKEDLAVYESIHQGFASAALVHDSALYGATSAILGQAFRLEVSPYLGSINYFTVLADMRRYVMPVRPFTLAFRLLHYGRYGKGAEDVRLYPIFLGYETLVRGYNWGSFGIEEFNEGGFVWDQLWGSKLAVANFELRFPFFRVLGLGRGYYGILPTDFIAFFDAGVAWTNKEKPKLLYPDSGTRKLLSSVGFGLRTNLFGYFVIGLNLVRPLDRPQKGWYFQFTITPGF